jgi:hypothetical protein
MHFIARNTAVFIFWKLKSQFIFVCSFHLVLLNLPVKCLRSIQGHVMGEFGTSFIGSLCRLRNKRGTKRQGDSLLGSPWMEEINASETSVDFCETTRRIIPERCHMLTRGLGNLKSHMNNLSEFPHGST